MKKDIWINIPVLVDDNYMVELAKLFKARLDPQINVHVEIGNELWNTAANQGYMGFFMQNRKIWEEFIIEKNPEKMKILGGFNNLEQASMPVNPPFVDATLVQRWMARRLKEHMESFASIFGQSAIGTRFRAMLTGQVAYADFGNGWNIKAGIEFLEKTYGRESVKKYLYGF